MKNKYNVTYIWIGAKLKIGDKNINIFPNSVHYKIYVYIFIYLLEVYYKFIKYDTRFSYKINTLNFIFVNFGLSKD